MIFENLNKIKKKKFFAIIVGSGPAGISTALKLEKNGFDSLILESGSADYNFNSQKYLDGDVIGDNYSDLKISRLKQFGGSSGHWGGNCNTLKEKDFSDWPIKKGDLDIYEREASKILNIKEKFYNKKFSENLNYFNTEYSNVKFYEKYFEYIKRSKKISLSLDTTFHSLEGSNGNVTNLICFKEKFYKLKSKHVVLSCGGIENSRSLLLAKKKNPGLFKYELPIGKYYMDHPKHDIGNGIIIYKKLKNFLLNQNVYNFPTLECRNIQLSLSNDIPLKKKILNSGLTIKLKRTTPYTNLIRQASCVAPKFIQNIYSSFKEKDVYEFYLSIIQEQFPYRDNRIELGPKLDPQNLQLPLIYWKRTSLLKKSAQTMINEFSDILINENIGRLSINDNILNDSNYDLTLGNHQLGGTRIGKDINDSVVDKNLLVFGFKNLYINGSSVFRTGGFAHPTFTIVQLATRLGEHLTKV